MKVLVVDDERLNIDLLEQELAEVGIDTIAAADGRAAMEVAMSEQPDLILLDIMMPGIDGFDVCRRLKSAQATRDIPILFMTALNDTRDKLQAFSAGAVDYITKPFQTEELLARVRTHLELHQARMKLQQQNLELRAEIEAHQRARETIDHLVDEIDSDFNHHEMIGESAALKSLLDGIKRVASTDTTVLVEGETGTGKELIARAIHAHSPRNAQPLVKVNCAALPRELVESELFGHEMGAFTGATRQRKGRFELADRGSIFLDEIGELPLESQAKLLRVLQDQLVERIGGSHPLHTDVRVIAATNRDLAAEVEAGRFRADLYYRLNVFPLVAPPLRERREDIAALAEHFMKRACRRLGKSLRGLSPAFRREAERYHWPGNVRELENVVMRAAILSSGPYLELGEPLSPSSSPQSSTGRADAQVQEGSRETLEAVERRHILNVLQDTRWVVEGDAGAAAVLGLNPSTLRGRMRKLGIRKPA